MSDVGFREGAGLPVELEELVKYSLFTRERLTAVRAQIRALDILDMASAVRDQKKREAQALAEALLDAETKIGELTRKIPEGRGGDRRSEDFKTRSVATFETKQDAIDRLGLEKDQVHRFETLALHPDIVAEVKADARENDDLPTRTEVLRRVAEKKKRAAAPGRAAASSEGEVQSWTLSITDLVLSRLRSIRGLDQQRKALRALARELSGRAQTIT